MSIRRKARVVDSRRVSGGFVGGGWRLVVVFSGYCCGGAGQSDGGGELEAHVDHLSDVARFKTSKKEKTKS